MPNYALNNVTTADQYTAPNTLAPLPVLDHVNIDVSNAAIYWQLQQTNDLTSDRSGSWQTEVFMSPGSRTLSRAGMVGVRVRSAAPGVPAQATVEAVES